MRIKKQLTPEASLVVGLTVSDFGALGVEKRKLAAVITILEHGDKKQFDKTFEPTTIGRPTKPLNKM
jgi:hypothetical protein